MKRGAPSVAELVAEKHLSHDILGLKMESRDRRSSRGVPRFNGRLV